MIPIISITLRILIISLTEISENRIERFPCASQKWIAKFLFEAEAGKAEEARDDDKTRLRLARDCKPLH